MDPGPKVALSILAVKIFNNKSSIISPSARFRVTFSRNGYRFWSQECPTMPDDDGCVVAVCHRLIVLAINVFVVDVFQINTEDNVKLGSVYLDLEDLLKDGLFSNSVRKHNAIMESEDFPAMQLFFAPSSFSPSAPPRPTDMLTCLAFEICSEETTDADFIMYLHNLDQLLLNKIFLFFDADQLWKLRDRCLALASASDQLCAFTLCAGLFDNHFRDSSYRRTYKLAYRGMYGFARMFYQDYAAVLGGLDRPMQSSFTSALISLPNTDATKTIRMQAFGSFLIRRHRLATGDQGDLTQGVSLLETVDQLRAGPYSRDPILDHFSMLLSMSNAYDHRYKLSHNVVDLDLALTAASKAVELQVPWWIETEEERHAAHYALSRGLLERFERLGAQHDLERAAECAKNALDGVSADSHRHVFYLWKYQGILDACFLLSGEISDSEKSMKVSKEIIADVKVSNPYDVLMAKLQLAKSSLRRACPGRYVLDSVIEQPINDNGECAAVLPPSAYYEDGVHMRRAIDLLREVINNPDCREVVANNANLALGKALFNRFRANECHWQPDLDEAISILSRIPAASGSAPGARLLLGHALYCRYIICGRRPKDIRSAISISSGAASSRNLLPRQQLLAAKLWVGAAEELEGEERASSVMEAYGTAMSIIPSIVWIGMAMQDRHDILIMADTYIVPFNAMGKNIVRKSLVSHGSIGRTANSAADFAIGCGKIHTAITWLEQGRSIIWDQLLQFRIPLDDLREADLELGEKLKALSKELSRSSTMPHFWKRHVDEDGRERKVALEAEGQKHRRLVSEWQQAVTDARQLPGFHDFLLPKDFDYLSGASDDSLVVIINVSSKASDALIIIPAPTGDSAKKDVLHVPLTFTFFDAKRMHTALLCLIRNDVGIRSDLARKPVFKDFLAGRNASFRTILGDLWYKVVLPILCGVMEVQPSLVNCDEGANRAHLHWCPTGHLAFLPLHAAGDYSMPGKGHRVFDFVVSSYIPTLNSIIRPTSPAASTMDSTIKVLAVACPYAEGQIPIPDTEEEVARVGKHVVPLLDESSSVSHYTALVKQSATAERVLEEMKEATWVHLACHGTQDATTPINSALLLSDGTQILLSDIAALDLPHAEFAFLSACQTATGYDNIPSESMHLAAGMLLAGYRSVIATMWSIADRHAPHVADDVYAYLLRNGISRRPDYKESGLALHLAMEKLRERIGESSFEAWVPYIHIGA